MQLPEREWFTIDSLAKRWSTSEDLIYHYFETEKLRPSIKLYAGVELMWVTFEYNEGLEDYIPNDREQEVSIDGVYDIISYKNLHWHYDESLKAYTSNLKHPSVYIRNVDDKYVYYVIFGYSIKKSDIIVTNREVMRFEGMIEDLGQVSSLENNRKSIEAPPLDDPEIQKTLELGRKFKGKGKQYDSLSKLIYEYQKQYYQKNQKFAGWKAIAIYLESCMSQGVIDDVDWVYRNIKWDGKKETSFKQLMERITSIRKKILGMR